VSFKNWLNRLVNEKGINCDYTIEVTGNSGMNFIPVQCLLDMILSAPKHEQDSIKIAIVRIDSTKGFVMDYFKHLAKAIAL
jgi:hypothetical protein